MKKMGRYCKAYPIERFRAYPGWREEAGNARRVKHTIDGVETEAPRVLDGDAFLYLQETLVVTDGVYLEENVIFPGDGEGWARYCQEVLEFRVPEYLHE